MSKEFRLNCWVLGDDPDDVFTAKVQSEETVGHLKDVIMSKNPRFYGFPASSLALWKVDFPIDLTLRQRLSNVNLVDEEVLFPLELSEVFTDPPLRDNLHIIVRSPPPGESWLSFLAVSSSHRVLTSCPTRELHMVPQPKLELNCLIQGDNVHGILRSVRPKLFTTSRRPFNKRGKAYSEKSVQSSSCFGKR